MRAEHIGDFSTSSREYGASSPTYWDELRAHFQGDAMSTEKGEGEFGELLLGMTPEQSAKLDQMLNAGGYDLRILTKLDELAYPLLSIQVRLLKESSMENSEVMGKIQSEILEIIENH
jgi:hypothetical protein